MMRTYLNCTWAERRMPPSAPLWHESWRPHLYCLALSEEAEQLVEVQPERCGSCPYWRPRAELSRPGDHAKAGTVRRRT